MSPERLHSAEELRGKSIADVVSLIPTFPWFLNSGGRIVYPRVIGLTVVDYDTHKPRRDHDVFGPILVTPGSKIEKVGLSGILPPKLGQTTGLISMVETEIDHPLSSMPEKKLLHFSMIDMDLNIPGLSQEKTLALLKREIREKTEIEKGVLLASGSDNHFHFIGTERLLDEEQLVTFLGLCLNMRGPDDELLVDPRWVGHALTPMKYLVILDGRGSDDYTSYDYTNRFATLRITTSKQKPTLPIVVDVL